MDVESFEERLGGQERSDRGSGSGEERGDRESREETRPSSGGPLHWLKTTNHSPAVIDFIKRARRALPGDPDFGDPLSVDGVGGPRAAARAADRLLERDAVSKEVSLAGLQVWQALTERISGRPANPEVTLVFTDLVGFSDWSLRAGDDATLTLLRRVAQVAEPPLLAAGGHIVKRMGDGTMAVFSRPVTAVSAVLDALDAVRTVEVGGYVPRMRAGIHTGRPQRIGSDWLGVDVNITARVMDQATKGGLVVSQTTLDSLTAEDVEELGITTKRVRRPLFAPRIAGLPENFDMHRVKVRRSFAAGDPEEGRPPGA